MINNSYLQIFIAFFKIGATTFGGGYAMLPIIKQEAVTRMGWVSDEEFVDALAVAQSLPGAVAVNTSIFIGYKVRGYSGALTAMLGAVLPSFIAILLIAVFFMQFTENRLVAAAFAGIRPAVAALIASAVWKLGKPVLKKQASLLLAGLFLLLAAGFRVHPMIIIIAGAALGIILTRFGRRKESEGERM